MVKELGSEQFSIVIMKLIHNYLCTMIDTMANTVVRTATSTLCKDLFDFSTGFCDAEGNTLAEGLVNPAHSGGYTAAFRAIREIWGDEIYPGDVFMNNDPYGGASHVPDVYMFRPTFVEGRVVAYAVAEAHQLDIGARVPGGNAPDNEDVYQEGLKVSSLKYYERGVRNYTLYRVIEKNVRLPHMVLGDLEALVAATAIGEREFLKLVERYGWLTLNKYINALMNYSERLSRESIRALPDGVYEAEDFLDDDGFVPKPVKIKTKVIVDGDNIIFDFTGSSPTVRGSVNNPVTTTISMVNVCERLILDPNILSNSGAWRPIKIIAPENTVVNAGFPAGVAARGITMTRVYDCVTRALAKVAPDAIPACGSYGDFGICMSGRDENGELFIFTEFIMGSWGARPWADGINANTCLFLNYSNLPCEVAEERYPIRVESNNFITDSAGPGKYRGGLGIVKSFRVLFEEAQVTWRQERADFPCWGLQGGKSGTTSKGYHISADGKKRGLRKSVFTAKKGDLLVCMLSGGGGFGNPFERDIDKVVADVRNEFVSIESARKDYGVVIDEKTMRVNLEETQKIRGVSNSGTGA